MWITRRFGGKLLALRSFCANFAHRFRGWELESSDESFD